MCGKQYIPTGKNQKYCAECSKENQKRLHSERYKRLRNGYKKDIKNNNLDKKLEQISFYNKSNGTSYTYGQYKVLERLKKL